MYLKFNERFSYKAKDEYGNDKYGKTIVNPGEIVELEGEDAERALDGYAKEVKVEAPEADKEKK